MKQSIKQLKRAAERAVASADAATGKREAAILALQQACQHPKASLRRCFKPGTWCSNYSEDVFCVDCGASWEWHNFPFEWKDGLYGLDCFRGYPHEHPDMPQQLRRNHTGKP